jgi:hypothetical protein
MPAVPYFFVLKSLTKLAIFNQDRVRGAACKFSSFRTRLADVGNFGVRPFGG